MDLHLLEHRVRVESTERQFLDALARCFDGAVDGRHPTGSAPIDLRITLTPSVARPGRAPFEVTSDPPDALPECPFVGADQPVVLASALNLWCVRQSRRCYVFHAGAVARDGRAILLPAASGSGKSTLTTALLRRGFALLSDEVGALEVASGRLVAYPRALWLRPRSLAVLGLDDSLGASLDGGRHRVVSIDELGARRACDSPIPALVVQPKFQPRGPTHMELLRTGPAVMALMESSCSQPQFKVRGLDLVIDLARRLPCYRLVFSDLQDAVAAIEEAFELASEEAP